jgi:hypothetical protein
LGVEQTTCAAYVHNSREVDPPMLNTQVDEVKWRGSYVPLPTLY